MIQMMLGAKKKKNSGGMAPTVPYVETSENTDSGATSVALKSYEKYKAEGNWPEAVRAFRAAVAVAMSAPIYDEYGEEKDDNGNSARGY